MFELFTRPTNNRLPLDCRELLQREIIRLNDNDIIITIKKAGKKVSLNQYRYYYAVIIKYWCEFTGYTKNRMDTILKNEFAKFEGWIDEHGFVLTPSKSDDFDTAIQEDFNRYCRKLYYDMTEANIPKPNETLYNY